MGRGPDSLPITMPYVYTVENHFLYYKFQIKHLCLVATAEMISPGLLSGILMSTSSNIMGNATTTSSLGQATKQPTEEIRVRGPTVKWDSDEGLVNRMMILTCCSSVTVSNRKRQNDTDGSLAVTNMYILLKITFYIISLRSGTCMRVYMQFLLS